ncbi:MAG: hypothetical protein ABIT10_06675 [Alteraurantiacibacter sp.]
MAALLLALTACATDDRQAEVAAPPPASPAEDAAALLALAEAAPTAEARAVYVERLDALGVHLADDAGSDDPLAQWRNQPKSSDSAPWRGRALGPAYRRAVVLPGESLVIQQIFLAGQRAQIAAQVSGRGESGAVALAISNPRAEAICTRQVAPRASCNWLPVFTERFAIALQNNGTRTASVYLVVR